MRGVLLFCTLFVGFMAPRAAAQDGVAFTTDSALEVTGISTLVLQGHATLSEAGEDSVRVLLTIDGSTVIDDGVFCLLCVETVAIGPDLAIPATFFAGRGGGVLAIRLTDYASTRSLNVDSPYHIVSGPTGATLRKSGSGFVLLEGNAWLAASSGMD